MIECGPPHDVIDFILAIRPRSARTDQALILSSRYPVQFPRDTASKPASG
jgi:hypothetical protein